MDYLPPTYMSGPNWEQLFRNGQLTWKTSLTHREMLIRHYEFYKNTVEVEILPTLYPGFIEAYRKNEFPEIVQPNPKPKKEKPILSQVVEPPKEEFVVEIAENVEEVVEEPAQVAESIEEIVEEQVADDQPKKKRGRKPKISQ